MVFVAACALLAAMFTQASAGWPPSGATGNPDTSNEDTSGLTLPGPFVDRCPMRVLMVLVVTCDNAVHACMRLTARVIPPQK